MAAIEMSDLIQATIRTINRRSAWFRNLIVAVAALPAVTVIAAALLRSWLPLAGFIALVPLCGAYLLLDITLVRRWQQRLLAAWIDGDISLRIFMRAITSLPGLPQATLGSMLATLPAQTEALEQSHASAAARALVALVSQTLAAGHRDQAITYAAALTIVLAAGAAALTFHSWQFLLGALGLLPVFALGAGAAALRCRRTLRALEDAQLTPAERAATGDAAAALDWAPVHAGRRERWLRALAQHNSTRIVQLGSSRSDENHCETRRGE